MDCRSSLARAERRYRQRHLKEILEIGLCTFYLLIYRISLNHDKRCGLISFCPSTKLRS